MTKKSCDSNDQPAGQATQGRAGWNSRTYRSGDPSDTEPPRVPLRRFAGVRNLLGSGRNNSKLVYAEDPGDPGVPDSKGASDRTYKQNNYDPATEVEKYSYTSTRVAKRVYNTYGATQKNTQVFGYYTDWSQYDGRLDGNYANSAAGRGTDLMLLNASAYDRLIIGFAGIVGDTGEKQYTIDQAAVDFGKKLNEATFTDPWGDVASYRNVGFSGWVSNDYRELFDQSKAQGVLGGLAKLKQQNPNLKLSFSLGGWTMSGAFHAATADATRRQTLIESIAYIFDRFPMFTEVDLDWEYPGMPGAGNPHGPEDAAHFQALVRGIKLRLPHVRVSIAAGAAMDTMIAADIPGMLAAGVEGINLMTYDFFGTPWAEKLAHHTNLFDYEGSQFSIDKSVKYLLSVGVPSKNIFVGYAAYSRSARNAVIESWSPLVGTYSPGTGTTTGSYESGASEFYDILYNYLDLENRTGINGFNVYTDQEADADYLFNPETGLFLSIDTPRSVKAKGEYVLENNLGGLFTWTIDMDNGVLLNAAREGLGATVKTEVVDMEPFYFEGINTGNVGATVAVIEGPTEAFEGDEVSFSGLRSHGAEPLTYKWSAPGLAFLDGKTSAVVEGLLPLVTRTYTVTLTVTDANGKTATDSQNLVVKKKTQEPPTSRITVLLESGTPYALSAEASFDPDDNPLTYVWDAPDLPFDGSTDELVEGTAPSVTAPTDYWVKLTVNDGADTDQSAIFLTIVPGEASEGDVVAVITGRTQVESGAPIQLSASDSSGPAPLLFSWSAPGLSFDGADSVTVNANAPLVDRDTIIEVKLTATGAAGTGDKDTTAVQLRVLAGGSSDTAGTWRPQSYETGAEVTNNYQGQGLHKYRAKWWVGADQEPGDPNFTSTIEGGDSKPWLDLGPA
ncbi:chitinase family 18 [Ralstonia sp. 25mfcol4.1]|uniref:glycoside hydrolase family 18 protein n=1 Tax=Burkholderiaceae TaxID=119060 RepID=UPI000880D34F|nr:glycosyl hydrolase family 18 protein [Ralstonia sp. 25mfcol4.1]SDP70768.1 chitinase family 18 [Ralstonia sp. 25mfcol4.1]